MKMKQSSFTACKTQCFLGKTHLVTILISQYSCSNLQGQDHKKENKELQGKIFFNICQTNAVLILSPLLSISLYHHWPSHHFYYYHNHAHDINKTNIDKSQYLGPQTSTFLDSLTKTYHSNNLKATS